MNKAKFFEAERREKRTELTDDEFCAHFDNAVNFDQLMAQMNTNDGPIISTALNTLLELLQSSKDLSFMDATYINPIINILDSFINNEYDVQITKKSMNILMKMFSMKICNGLHPSNATFFKYYLANIGDPNQFGTCLSVIKKVIHSSITLKQLFYESGCFDFFISTPITQLPLAYLESFSAITSICINSDMCFELPIEIPSQLLTQLLKLTINPHRYPPLVLDQVARGCYYYASINNEAKYNFIINNYHVNTINAIGHMTVIGNCYLVSALGLCFFNDHAAEKAANEIPLDIFRNALEFEDDAARVDTSIAIENLLTRADLLGEKLFTSGLLQAIMNHFFVDNFNTKRHLLNAIANAMKKVPNSIIPLFVSEQFLLHLEELTESDDPRIIHLATDIAMLIQNDEQHKQIISDFTEYLNNHEFN